MCVSVAALQLQLLLAEPGDWLQLLGLGRNGCYRRTCLFVFLCLSVDLSVHLFFPSVFLGGWARLALPVRRLWSWGSALSGTAGAAASSLPGFAGAARCGLPIPAGGCALRAPSLAPGVSVCPSVSVCVSVRAGVRTPGKGTCSGWRWVKRGAPISNFCY